VFRSPFSLRRAWKGSHILRRMDSLRDRLREPRWGLPLARSIAEEIAGDKAAIRVLVRELFGEDVEVRKRAADVARRVSERDGKLLEPYSDEFAGLLETLPASESRTRWHLGMVVPRVAHTRMQRLRAARTMSLLAGDESNVVRCSAVEGLGLLALQEASLRDEAEEMIERFLREGTKAMKCRARHAMRKLMNKSAEKRT
jgi:HEAT repeat protein